MVNAQICTFLLEDKSTGYLVPIYSKGVNPELVEKMRFKKGESISGWVALNNEMLVKNNLEKDPWFMKQNKGEYFVNSLVSIPLSTKERVIGVLNLSNKKNGEQFGNDDLQFLKGLTTEASIALQNASLYEQIQDSYLRTITALAFALDARDSYTRQHSENVTKYAVAIAQELNLRPGQTEQIRRAGLLHDIGKIGIRDGVLLKPGSLSEEEYNDIKQHPLKGEMIVSALPFLKEEAKMIKHHHERFDGKGYPDGISGLAIEKGARILAVADSLDAMLEQRVYRKALGLAVACEELKKNIGKQFDPEVVNALLKLIEKNPNLFISAPPKKIIIDKIKFLL
jgi:putative nucleotidyltransferase with HDIG domain